jgi:hypothetical protein
MSVFFLLSVKVSECVCNTSRANIDISLHVFLERPSLITWGSSHARDDEDDIHLLHEFQLVALSL